jgi:DNA helicase-2/ATP-dependent DNA helicase PcrA
MNQNNDIDEHVDDEILTCLDFKQPKSFFLFAGAGSGKTRSLVNVLKTIQNKYKHQLILNNQRVAIITYTNAACNEIEDRLDYDSLFEVSTIHSFIWNLIRYYNQDIKKFLFNKISTDITDLQTKLDKVKKPNKTSIDRERKIESKKLRLKNLDNILQFTYNPNGDNLTKDSLNHSEVIEIGAEFLSNKDLMQRILARKYPILLIDESQDTNKNLIDSFFTVQSMFSNNFSLGLFGDMMQRIYFDGKENLGSQLPDDWSKPVKKMNHRCPKRVITLINKIREKGDGQDQIPRNDKEDGFVRLFIIDTNNSNKLDIEKDITKRMSEITNDDSWFGDIRDIKVLTIEHHMAAKRMGFNNLFEPLYNVSKLKAGLLDGSLSGMNLYTKTILPLYLAMKNDDKFSIARIVKERSLFFDKKKFNTTKNQLDLIQESNVAVKKLFKLWDCDNDPKLIDILQNISESKLFDIPESLSLIAKRTNDDIQIISETKEQSLEEKDDVIEGWDKALQSNFSEVELYYKYINDEAGFGTHQGVKGLEFDRVMVILDDEDSRGFMFSYDKLFGVKEESERDIKNRSEGKETGVDRTRRLFYVTCSRAQKSLAVVAYTSDVKLLKKNVLEREWFLEDEIVII